MFYAKLICLFGLVGAAFADDINTSLTRDGYGRSDPNQLLNGFFPAWPILLLCLAG